MNKKTVNKAFRAEWKKEIEDDHKAKERFDALSDSEQFWVRALAFFFFHKGLTKGDNG